MAHSFFTTFFNSFLLFLILAGSIELRFHDGKAAASQPSASARARANRLLAAKRPNHAKCPQSMTSCPIAPIIVKSKSLQSRLVNKQKITWECLDLEQELTACGRCDNDCMKLSNVENVGCESGKCKIFTCAPGHSAHEEIDSESGLIVTRCV
ncbi:hypothetical protein PCASD_18415 [Puccinia coronata f. sp. avenae]|uniref:Protein CPL1-like domain-containing protein n=1 Tax=Puccinia coronata f. sp. avenae TaxID=200324 RepID=A0A2N5TTN2_9BASI|nr:hypothetical protein PCASD_18415 [Puccinia coronata f. sp. avenae]